MRFKYLILIVLVALLLSCHDKNNTIYFNSFLNEPCMIVNSEQDNSIEGTYLIAKKIIKEDSIIIVNFENQFFITNSNCSNWLIGWGNNKPNEDAGSENLMTITNLDIKNKSLHLGQIIKGTGFPLKNQRLVFWNRNPTNFSHYQTTPLINPKQWPEFSGESVHFASVIYDSISANWYLFFNEAEGSKIQIYAAMSSNLVTWKPANNGNPILRAENFANCSWAGYNINGSTKQTPFVSDIIYYKNQWYLFMDGYDKKGKRKIGIATSKISIISGYQIFEHPLLESKNKAISNNESYFYAKIKKYKNGFIMFYDCKDSNLEEHVNMAFSEDLMHWENYVNNPVIAEHYGWQSKKDCSEPNYIEIHHDSIFLLITGAKKSKANFWHHYISKQMYLDISGNVDDAELGFYISLDGGKTFKAHKNNPVFTNDYSSVFENDHLGGNIQLIKTDSIDYLFYQAKCQNIQFKKYSVLLRTHKK